MFIAKNRREIQSCRREEISVKSFNNGRGLNGNAAHLFGPVLQNYVGQSRLLYIEKRKNEIKFKWIFCQGVASCTRSFRAKLVICLFLLKSEIEFCQKKRTCLHLALSWPSESNRCFVLITKPQLASLIICKQKIPAVARFRDKETKKRGCETPPRSSCTFRLTFTFGHTLPTLSGPSLLGIDVEKTAFSYIMMTATTFEVDVPK